MQGKKITAYPALIETEADKGAFKVELFDSPEKAFEAHEKGMLAFVKKALTKEVAAYIKKQMLNNPKITLAYRALTIGNEASTLVEDMVDAVLLQSYLQTLPCEESAYHHRGEKKHWLPRRKR